MTKKIQVVVSPTGVTTIQTSGFRGAECKEATKSLQQALGIPTLDVPTAEYYQSPVVNGAQTQSE